MSITLLLPLHDTHITFDSANEAAHYISRASCITTLLYNTAFDKADCIAFAKAHVKRAAAAFIKNPSADNFSAVGCSNLQYQACVKNVSVSRS